MSGWSLEKIKPISSLPLLKQTFVQWWAKKPPTGQNLSSAQIQSRFIPVFKEIGGIEFNLTWIQLERTQ